MISATTARLTKGYARTWYPASGDLSTLLVPQTLTGGSAGVQSLTQSTPAFVSTSTENRPAKTTEATV